NPSGLRSSLDLERGLIGLSLEISARTPHLALAGRDAYLDALAYRRFRVPGREAVLHRHRAEHGIGGRIEGGEESVAQALDLPPPVAAHDRQQERVVERQHVGVLLAGLTAGARGEPLHVREQEDEVSLRLLHGSA